MMYRILKLLTKILFIWKIHKVTAKANVGKRYIIYIMDVKKGKTKQIMYIGLEFCFVRSNTGIFIQLCKYRSRTPLTILLDLNFTF